MRQWGFEMKDDKIRTYLRALERKLWLRGLSNPETMAELESHLLESVAGGLRSGLNFEEAQTQALERFGSVKVIANTFEKERMDWMQNLLLGIAVLAGLFFAYVDSRPTWDDTGVLAGAILLTCGLLALVGYRRPWLLALVVGAWIPLRGIFITHNYFSLLALIIAFLGAYGGWAVRLGIRKTSHLA
jgi:hypothetical protein